MASLNYNTPGVYSVRVKGQPVFRAGTIGIAGMVGTCKRGDVSEPFITTSWDDCAEKIAGGLDSPFLRNSHLAFAAQSFFRNGGSTLYISRACTDSIAKAECFVDLSDGTQLVFEAKDEGAWGNDLKIWVTLNEIVDGTFDLHVQQGNNSEVQYKQLSNEVGNSRYFKDYINVYSNEVNLLLGDSLEEFGEQTFSGGDDGEDGITDADYLKALQKFDAVDEITLIAIPGQTSFAITQGIISYCNQHEFVFAAIDAPITYRTKELKELRARISCDNAILLNTWHRISDPLSSVNGMLRAIPSSGAYLGNVAKTAERVGVWKEPAGTSNIIDGAVDLVFNAQKSDTDVLNPLGIINIITKKNVGICIWGARSLSNDSDYLYVSAILLDIYIRKNIQETCQSIVFDPNKEGLDSMWGKVRAAATGFLDSIREQGGLASDDPALAYFVKCDEETNPKSVTNQGYCICRCGYAYARPGEFIIFEFQNSLGE